MAICSLNDLTSLIKQLIKSQDAITVNLIKIDSLLSVALDENLLNNGQNKLYNYIWTISDITEGTLSISEQHSNQLIKAVTKLKNANFLIY